MKGPTLGPSQRAVEAGGSLALEVQGRVGAAPTTTGWVSTTRWPRSGKQDGKVQREVNQWWNPLKRRTGSKPGGSGPASSARPWVRTTPKPVLNAGGEAMEKDCGVPMARLQGNSWAPTPSTGCTVNVGTVVEPPSPPASQVGDGQDHRRPMASRRGGAPVVVGGRESRPHGEGGQRVRSFVTGMPGGRW